MSDPIIDRLDQIRDRADKATEGPWEAEYSGEQGNCVLPPGYQSTREAVAITRLWLQAGDAKFIAHARTDVPQMEQALRAVLATLDEWRPVDPCTDDLPCADCVFHAELYKAIASALGIETEGGEK